MSEDTAYIMQKLLLHPVYGSQGTGVQVKPYVTNTQVFAKTGTTDSQNDLWFVGGTPYYVASCWYGYDSPAWVNDNKIALRMWGTVMQQIHKDLPKKEFPSSSYVTIRHYCAETGLIANSTCPIGGTGYYKQSYLPTCTKHAGSITASVSSKYDIGKEPSSSITSGSSSSGASSTVTIVAPTASQPATTSKKQ